MDHDSISDVAKFLDLLAWVAAIVVAGLIVAGTTLAAVLLYR